MSHILIVESRFYGDIADMLRSGATAEIDEQGHSWERVPVPGALEIPAAIAFAIDNGRYDGFVALGCVIRGETSHYDHVCQESIRGLNDLAMRQFAPIGNGILTVENPQQAAKRADPKQGNKGAHAARAALVMIGLKRKFITGGR